jgi:hypothetical protein
VGVVHSQTEVGERIDEFVDIVGGQGGVGVVGLGVVGGAGSQVEVLGALVGEVVEVVGGEGSGWVGRWGVE